MSLRISYLHSISLRPRSSGLIWFRLGCREPPMHSSWSLKATLFGHSWKSSYRLQRSRQWSNRLRCMQLDGFCPGHRDQLYRRSWGWPRCLYIIWCPTTSLKLSAHAKMGTFLASRWGWLKICRQMCPQRILTSCFAAPINQPCTRCAFFAIQLSPF